LHLRGAFPLERLNPREVQLFLAGQALSRIYTPSNANFREKSGLGFPLADPIIGVLITVAILAVLRTAARDVFRRLLDAIDPALVAAAETTLAAEPGVTAVRSVKMRWIGHRIHADAELDIDPSTSLTNAHQIAHDAEHALTHAIPKLSSALVHAYPASPTT
ncbi:cation diffusion facilitator family transporter, partial [Mycobacterium sp. ZZG]